MALLWQQAACASPAMAYNTEHIAATGSCSTRETSRSADPKHMHCIKAIATVRAGTLLVLVQYLQETNSCIWLVTAQL